MLGDLAKLIACWSPRVTRGSPHWMMGGPAAGQTQAYITSLHAAKLAWMTNCQQEHSPHGMTLLPDSLLEYCLLEQSVRIHLGNRLKSKCKQNLVEMQCQACKSVMPCTLEEAVQWKSSRPMTPKVLGMQCNRSAYQASELVIRMGLKSNVSQQDRPTAAWGGAHDHTPTPLHPSCIAKNDVCDALQCLHIVYGSLYRSCKMQRVLKRCADFNCQDQ